MTAPLIRFKLLGDATLRTGLISMALVSTIMMATLIVGPFYLSGALDLTPVQNGLVMSVGAGIAALPGVPAGRLVDRLGSARVIIAGLVDVTAGAVLMTMLPGRFGVRVSPERRGAWRLAFGRLLVVWPLWSHRPCAIRPGP